MSDFISLYASLDKGKQKEVMDFATFLFQKQSFEKKENFGAEKFREKLLNVSVWDEESLKMIENSMKNIKLNITEW